jgi:ELWxxDGT repeat protein
VKLVAAATLALLHAAACGDNIVPELDAAPGDPHMVADLHPADGDHGSSFPSFLTPFGGRLCFTAFPVSVAGGDLVCSDGTAAGTETLHAFDYYPHHLTVAGVTLYMLAGEGAAYGLWTSDGTAAGTVQVKAIPDAAQLSFGPMAQLGGGVVFSVAAAKTTLWASDGTAAGTIPLAELSGTQYLPVISDGARAFVLVGSSDPDERGLWLTDGTAAGTARVVELPAGVTDVTGAEASFAGDMLYLHFFDGTWDTLYRSDGVTMDAVHQFAAGHVADQLTIVDGVVYLRLHEMGSTSTELWRSDGSDAGTTLVRAGDVTWLASYRDALYFIGGGQLWRSDGTAAGTVALAPLGADAGFGLSVAGGRLWVTADDGEHGPEAWLSDGSAAGTRLWFDLVPGAAGSRPHGFTAIGPQIFFVADDGKHGDELWVGPTPTP